MRPLTINQEKLLGLVRAESVHRARRAFERLNLSEVEKQRLLAARRKCEGPPPGDLRISRVSAVCFDGETPCLDRSAVAERSFFIESTKA